MSGIVLRLAGPLQSWGEHSTFSERDTLRFPTRSGIIGLLAAAQGISRGKPLDRYDPLRLTVRIDRHGTLTQDFHTAGGGVPRSRSIPTAEGKRRAEGKATVVTRRWYLSDAVFTIGIEGPDTLIQKTAAALARPHWPPYLGRRSCPPDQPLLLRAVPGNPVTDLRERVPLPGPGAPGGNDVIDIEMITEIPDAEAPSTEVADVPDVLGRHERRYRTRAVYQTTVQVPARLAAWRTANDYHKALHEYARTLS
ncbi:MAG: type I-E CRISPR-associated protein Cas5/CasD [Nocardiopsaceae bacterium]|nr:type I-E CRISPR-associated protein Cas5/CasD [Nocardiopsaceae bacterium]